MYNKIISRTLAGALALGVSYSAAMAAEAVKIGVITTVDRKSVV